MICDVCKEETGAHYFGAMRDGKIINGHRRCLNFKPRFGDNIRHLWGDGMEGSWSPGWRDDVEHRKLVDGGEVVRDYGRKHFSLGGR